MLAVVLGLLVAGAGSFGLAKPARWGDLARKFPRSLPWGYALMLLGTVWFILYVRQEQIADFEGLKPYLYALFIGTGIGACLFVQDFLAVRGAAVVMLLLAKMMVDTARWADTEWRLVIITWAYVLAVAGMWFTISPWRMRDLLEWGVANEMRIRIGSGLRLGFGLLVIILGLTVFRSA